MVQCTGYDLTISVDKSTPDHNVIGANLGKVFSKFVFQKENADGYLHWQAVTTSPRALSPY